MIGEKIIDGKLHQVQHVTVSEEVIASPVGDSTGPVTATNILTSSAGDQYNDQEPEKPHNMGLSNGQVESVIIEAAQLEAD